MFLRRRFLPDLVWGVPALIVAWLPFFIWFFWETPYKMHMEEIARGYSLQQVVQSQTTAITDCSTSLRASEASKGLLSSQVSTQQQTLNSQQATVNSQQATLNAQQGTVNTCVVKLSELNVPTPAKLEFVSTKDEPNPNGKHVTLIVVTANKVITPVKIALHCEQAMDNISYDSAGAAMTDGGAKLINDHQAYVIMVSPAVTPERPMLIRIYHVADDIGVCQFKQIVTT